jgi:CRP-like cAMP-binding protein
MHSVIAISENTVANRLVSALPQRDRRHLLAAFESVDLTIGDELCEPGQQIRHAYFPLEGFISLVISVDGRANLELDLIGNEGMFGSSLLLGVSVSPLRALVQGSGSALRISPASLRHELGRSDALRNMLNRYIYVSLVHLAEVAACNSFHALNARLVRWILMTHDRAHSDCFHLTHEFLAQMLGVRRVGVTNAAGALQKRGLVSYSRGNIKVLDRAGLESSTCSCYQTAKNTYEQVLG